MYIELFSHSCRTKIHIIWYRSTNYSYIGTISMDVLAKITEYREKKNWSLFQLSQQAGLSYKTIYKWYNGETSPTLKALDAVAQALDIELYELFTSDETVVMNDEIQELLHNWEKLNSEEKDIIFKIIKNFKK